MRFTVASKIWLGCIVIVAFGIIPMLMAYRGVLRVRREMRHLAEVNEPVKSAAHEMEINVKGIAIGTLGYLSTPSPMFRELVANNEADFERFHAEYLRLAATAEEKELGQAIGRLYEQLRTHAGELRASRDRQAGDFAAVLANLQEMERMLDQDLRATLVPLGPGDLTKLESIGAIEAGIAEIGMRVAAYTWFREEGIDARIAQKREACRAVFQQLHRLDWAAERQRQVVLSLEETFEKTMEKVREVRVREDEIHRGSARFIDLREEIDTLLDDRIQPLAVELLSGPRKEADAATASVVIEIGWLIPLFVLSAALVSLALTRTVTRPLKSLAAGTETVSRGDLAYRVPLVSRDEFAVLVQAFNRMVARLQETLVSKGVLERSEQELQRTVQALKQEISERMRAEEARVRLEASLYRAEALSAIGTLVAGVAHQVRNPLFGFSSVLDAMEARLGQREEYRPYLDALRGVVSRVLLLMNELMEFGRSGSVERTSGLVADAVHDAVSACQSLAEKAQVTVAERLDDARSGVLMDRPRLSRAFENLLENAVQHSAAGGAVTVTARELEEEDGSAWVEVRVEDCGPGFKEDLRRAFEPFFSRRQGGTGLGLALVERIIASHGGRVAAADRLEGGALLTVRLPAERSGREGSDITTAYGLGMKS